MKWEELHYSAVSPFPLSVHVLRLDLIDALTGGNKWFKLIGNLRAFHDSGLKRIISFGGPFSNHIAALGAFCKLEGIPCLAMIRGEPVESRTLRRAAGCGVELHFVGREDYRRFRQTQNYQELVSRFGQAYFIPEGGANEAGVKGCELIAQMIPDSITDILLPVGTGTTLAGISRGLKPHQRLWGISVLKAGQAALIQQFAAKAAEWQLITQFTFGGYAKSTPELEEFISHFSASMHIPLEPVYTGKLFYAVHSLISRGFFPEGSQLAVIHTGGLQYLHD